MGLAVRPPLPNPVSRPGQHCWLSTSSAIVSALGRNPKSNCRGTEITPAKQLATPKRTPCWVTVASFPIGSGTLDEAHRLSLFPYRVRTNDGYKICSPNSTKFANLPDQRNQRWPRL